VTLIKIGLGDRSFAVGTGSWLWNMLPASLRLVDNFSRLKRLLTLLHESRCKTNTERTIIKHKFCNKDDIRYYNGLNWLLLGEFAESLRGYEISIPVRVNADGDFVSHALHHTVHSSTHRRRRRSSTDTETDTVEYRVQVAGSDLQLTLEPSWNLLGPGLVFERRQAGRANLTDSTRLNTDVDLRLCHFRGHIRGRPDSTVAISTCNGLVWTHCIT